MARMNKLDFESEYFIEPYSPTTDELLPAAESIVMQFGTSVSRIQRELRIGAWRAMELLDYIRAKNNDLRDGESVE